MEMGAVFILQEYRICGLRQMYSLVHTNLVMIEVTDDELVVWELVPDVTLDYSQE